MALLLAMHDHGYTLAAVVFCLLLVALGHLAYHSTRYPRTLSTFLIVSFIGDYPILGVGLTARWAGAGAAVSCAGACRS